MHKQGPPSDTAYTCDDPHGKSILYNRDIVKPHTADALGEAAHRAVLLEISVSPKPGLVDRAGSGCHDDMDFDTFVRSADALRPFWKKQAQVGIQGTPPQEAMRTLRPAGCEMEAAMLAATGGVNTHKGLVYHLSLLLYGAGFVLSQARELTPASLLSAAAKPAAGSVEKELRTLHGKPEASLTNGEKLFLRHGVTGARGEAEKGFPSVLRGAEKIAAALDDGASPNDAALAALLAIMETCEDSNVIHRGGFAFWNGEYKRLVRDANKTFSPTLPDDTILKNLEESFLPLRISPGGAADLLCCSLFVNIVTNPTCQH